jgi:hypothetical protein
MGRPVPLSHTASPRHTHPATCTASVMVGNCRQSVKVKKCAPGFATRRHCPAHRPNHVRKERWSRVSPVNSG